ncbi:MAG: hypothetical protein J7K58_01680, partial [Euryarchaeota archaeon]|nr:hypothetical protein [Euryarchaeota archaeon]
SQEGNEYLWCGGWDLNPGTPTGRGLKDYGNITRDIIIYKDIREGFIKWMLSKTSKEYTKQLIRY